jgi:hypothetical protein
VQRVSEKGLRRLPVVVPPPPPPYAGPPGRPPAEEPAAPPPAPLGGPLRAPAAAYRALEEVYRDLDREIARLGPRCDGRGICCDFDLVDHVLFASRLEIDYVKDHVPSARYAAPTGNRCPFLEDGRCGARAVRMLGCRTYYCQAGFGPIAGELYERHYARVKAIAREHGLAWSYAPALAQLRSEDGGGPGGPGT